MGLKKYFDSPEWDVDVPEGSELQKMVTKPKSVKKITNHIEEKVNLKVTKSKNKLTGVKKSIDQKSEKKLKRKKIKQGLLLQQNELKSQKNKFAMDEVEDKIFVKERINSQEKSKVSNKKKEISKNALKKIKRKSIKADPSTEDKNQGILANIHKKLQEKREEYHEQKKKREKKKKSQNKGKNDDTENDLQNNQNQKNVVEQDVEICDMENISNGNSEKEVNRNDNKPRPLTKTEKNRKRRRKKNKPANVNSDVSNNLTSESSQQKPEHGKPQSDNSILEGNHLKSQTSFGQGSMKKMQLKNKLLNVLNHDAQTNGEKPNDEIGSQKLKKETNAPKSLRQKMLEKLKGARFRYLNEQMYSKESRDAKKLFSEDPSAFAAYHDGYRQQINKWPLNPLDVLIKDISRLPKGQTIADLGCGDARLSKSVPHKVFSFDLISLDPCVHACDMSHTPLLTGQVNVVVFCLSLMGINLKDYIIEANRILKSGGLMKIAEVESRFENIEEFTKQIEKYGFKLLKKDLTQNLFYFMDFKKEGDIGNRKKLPHLTLKPCLYKKR